MIQIVLGDVCYPKSEALIIPANTKGIMSRGVPARIIKDGLSSIFKEARQFITNNKVEVGDCFSTGPGRLKRRGLKKIYHAVTKRLQSDFTSIYIINKTLENTLQMVVNDGIETVTVCGLGLDGGDMDAKTVARITLEICNRYDGKVNIKIIDNNEEFIKELNKFVKE